MKASVVSCVGLMLPVFSNQRINAAMTVWTGFHCFFGVALAWCANLHHACLIELAMGRKWVAKLVGSHA